MNFEEYRKYGKEMVDYIADYLENIRDRRVFPNVQPGYIRHLLPESAPVEGEEWNRIFEDIERVIMPGITHWQSPHMHAYFPALNSGPSLLGDMLADAINCLGFTWASSPACTELETIVMNWLGKMIGLPDDYLHTGAKSKGGGAIQTTASESTLICLLAGRTQAIRRFHERSPGLQDSEINARLVAYCSDQAHSSVEKAALIGLVRMRFIESDENLTLRGAALQEAIKDDIKLGLVPFWVCATLGTTGACAFDNLNEIGDICMDHKIWLHVDAAYAGSAFICPEYRVWLKGIEKADSIAFNPSKWLMVHFDCTAMWVKNSCALHRTFNVEPLYLQHENSGLAIDYMHWQIPLSKRFRALKLWFVLRNYGIKGLQKHIREGVRLAQKFEALVLADNRFEIPAPRHLGMVVFRIKGENDLTERLLKRLNHRGNLHCVPASLKGKYVIRFTITSTHTSNDDLLKDWAEIRKVSTDLLEELNIHISDRARVQLKDTREKNEAFGSSLLLANSPMSPKIVNGSFAAIFDADEFLAKTYAGIRIASQNSPAMRRRVRGILMSGKQFSLDSRMDLVFHGLDGGRDAGKKNHAITEDGEESWEREVSEASDDEDTQTESPATKVKYNRLHQQEMPPQICGYDISPSLSTSSNEDSTPINTFQFAIVQKATLNDLFLSKQLHETSTKNFALNRRICNDLRISANKSFSQNIRPARPYLPPRRVDGSTFENSFEKRITVNRLSEKRQSDPQIRYAFYNKGFEIATSSKHRKYSLSHYEIRRKAMPDIDEYGSMENEEIDENDDSSDEWQGSRHLQYFSGSSYSGSSGRDITLLPKLKIRICDEMGARIEHSFDESSFSDENINLNEPTTAAAATTATSATSATTSSTIMTTDLIDEVQNCKHKASDPSIATSKQFIRNENVDNDASICKKCGHKLKLPKQFTNAFA